MINDFQNAVQLSNPLLSPVAWWEEGALIDKLARKVLLRALQDACGVNIMPSDPRDFVRDHARLWLESPDTEPFFELVGIEPEMIHDWVKAGCPVGKVQPLPRWVPVSEGECWYADLFKKNEKQ